MDSNSIFKLSQYRISYDIPKLCWKNKHQISEIQYYPAQLREIYGQEKNGWINKIFWGDNLQVMGHLLKDYRGKINLIYIDPPFCSQSDYKKKIEVRGIGKAESDSTSFEEKQYGDIWTNDEYLQFMYERLIILRELLSENGSIFLHCDWHKSAYLKIIMDEVFGNGGNNAAGPGYKNEIIWQRTGAHNDAGKYGVVHDTIYWYTKSSKYYFSMEMIPLTEEHVNSRFKTVEPETGRRFYPGPITAPGDGPARIFRGKTLLPPAGRHWSYSQENIDELEKQNRIYYSSTGIPYLKEYADEYTEQGRRLQSVWTDILPSKTGNEIVGYPTQKPEKLLERIIKACSRPGDLVFDCFMGSGTTQAVAMKLGRRFIGVDINLGAIQTTTKRLIHICNSKVIKNILDKTTFKYKNFTIYTVGNQTSNPLNIEVNAYRQNNRLIIDSSDINYIDSVMIDWNYDNKILKPTLFDIPDKQGLIKTKYEIPDNTTNIGIKLTDIFDRFVILEL